MIRLSLATSALLLMLMAGCSYDGDDTARSAYQRTETTRTHEATSEGAGTQPGIQSEQSQTTRTHQESTTTKQRSE